MSAKALHIVPPAGSAERNPASLFGRLDGPSCHWAILGEGSVLVVGTTSDQSIRILARPGPAGSPIDESRPQGWPRTGRGGTPSLGFAALLSPREAGGRIGNLSLATASGPQAVRLPRQPAALEDLVQAIAADAGPAFGDVVEGLVETLAAGRSGRAAAVLAGLLLRKVCRASGYVEIVGELDGASFVQGWSQDLEAGRSRLVVLGETVALATLEAATFRRTDLDGDARGFFGLVSGAIRLDATEHLFFRAQDTWRSLELYERRLVVAGTDVPAYMRDGLARGDAPAATLAHLTEVAERFDGRDTVSGLDRPVRVGIDFALAADDSGLVLAGWLVDPQGQAESVALRQGAAAIRLDENWTRLVRPDVTAAFAADRTFDGVMRDGAHGFMAFAPIPEVEWCRSAYLQIGLRGGGRAFYPLHPQAVTLRQAVDRMLTQLDPCAAASGRVVENQVAAAVAAARGPGPRVLRRLSFGPRPSDPSVALVIGLDRGAPDLTPLLTTLAIDPETKAVPIVIAAPAEIFDAIEGEAGRLARFYGLSLTLVLAGGIEDVCDAIEAGVAGCEAETLVLLSGLAQPRTRGWLGRLRLSHAAEGECVVSPTLLFEDDSIRWAGTWPGTGRATDRLVGYPVEAIAGLGRMEILAGTAECCVLSREAFARAGGFARSYLSATRKGIDFCLRLREAAIRSVWVPDIAVYLTDSPHFAGPVFAAQAMRDADRHTFDRRWAGALSTAGV